MSTNKVNLKINNNKEDVKISHPKKITKNVLKRMKRNRNDSISLNETQMNTLYKFERQEIEDVC